MPSAPRNDLSAMRDPTPADEPEQRADDADDERLDEQRPGDLRAAGADRAQQRVLALTLGGADAEHVVDDEAADEQRDDAKIVRKMVKKLRPSSIAVWFSSVISAPVSTSIWLSGRQRRFDPVGQLSVGHAAVAADDDGVDEPGLPMNELLRGRQVEQRPRRAARRVDVAERGDADDGELARPAWAMTVTVSPTSTSPFFGRRLCRSTTSSSPAAAAPSPIVQNASAVGDRRRRTSAGRPSADALPSLPMTRANPCTCARRCCTPGTAATSAIERVGDALALLGAEVALDDVRRADERVGVFEDVGEQIVERFVDRVAEHEHAAEERVPAMTASDVSSSRPLRARMFFSASLNMAHSPKRFMRSSTRSAVGSSISSTTLPSARKMTRSA